MGAHSVVSGKLTENSVYAGNPAVKIMDLDEYIAKRKKRQFEEAREFVNAWILAYGKKPNRTDLHEYFFLFEKDPKNIPDRLKEKLCLCENYDESANFMRNHPPMFDSFEKFIEACSGR